MADNGEMVNSECGLMPNDVCIVPENRAEVTKEVGLLVAGQENKLKPFIQQLKENKIRGSLFIDPYEKEIQAGVSGGDIYNSIK